MLLVKYASLSQLPTYDPRRSGVLFAVRLSDQWNEEATMIERTEDYIIRALIPFFVAGLAQLLHLKQRKQFDDASTTIQTDAEKILGMDINLILHMPYDHLIAVLRDDTPQGMVKCLILAELLKEKAEIYESEGAIPESSLCYLKSFNVFFEILFVKDSRSLRDYFPPEDFQQRFESLAHVTEKLMGFQLTEETLLRVISYYEQTGSFASAEDLLFEVIETTEEPQAAIDRGIAFFRRLRLKTNEELIAGDLPRDEVEAGLQELLDQSE